MGDPVVTGAPSGAAEAEDALDAADRRLDAYLSDVLVATARSAVHRMVGSLRRGVLRPTWRAIRALAVRLAPPQTRRRDALRHLAGGAVRARRGGPPPLRAATRRYRQYYAHTRPSPAALRSRTVALDYLEAHVSVTCVVVATGGDLAATLASLRAQVYDRTEVLVVADRETTVPSPARALVADGGFEQLANAAVAQSSGEYVLVVRAGDVLAAHCVCDLVVAVQDGADAAYGDEDRYDVLFEHHDGHLKPSRFGRETLLGYDVVGAPLLVRRELVVDLGGFDELASPVAEHDLALRLTERTDKVAHVGAVLISRPLADAPDPADATAATVGVVTRAFARQGRTARVEPGELLPSVRYHVDPPTPHPSVAIVVPTRDRLDLLRACLDSVERRSTYDRYSIVICDNDSKEDETLEWMASSGHTIVRCPGPFNYAAIVNRGVAHTDADFVVTLNNDTTIATPEWLERLVGLCSMEGVASVGVKLEYPDGRLQHEGVGIIPMPVHLSRDVNYEFVDRWLTSTRDAAAVTGACQIVRTDVWRALGGLDERLAVGYNDVDFCLRLAARGWRVAYTPEVLLGHRESASRGNRHPHEDVRRLVARWGLLDTHRDETMPAAARYVAGQVALVAGADGAAADVAPSGSGRLGPTARWLGDAARGLLDEGSDGTVDDALVRLAPPQTRRRDALRHLAGGAVRARRGGPPPLRAATRRYRQYYAHTRPSPAALRSRTVALDYLEAHVSVTCVVVATGGDLAATLASLRAQVYDRTEVLVVADRETTVPSPARALVADGGFEQLANAAVAQSSGEYVLVVRAGDVLAAHCVCDLVVAVQDGADAAYGDEDRYDVLFEHHDGHLKPSRFGRETLLSYDVVGAPLLVRRELVVDLGGFDELASPVAEHDLALRLTERTDKVAHVGAVLISRPLADAPDPADATAATVGVVTRAFARQGRTARVEPGELLPSVRYHVDPPTPHPSVAIVVPTRDRLDLLRACLDSVERRSTYDRYSIVICDNDSKEDETLEWMASSGHTIVRCPGPFNYAAIVNRGVAHTDADFVVTLNNDTTIATPEWLERLVGLCSMEGVASVGVKLEYPDGRLQHEGVGIIPMPVHLSRDVNYEFVDRWLTSTRDAAAVTGACQIVRTDVWRALGGLDERLAVAFNDVDFGMRLCAAGWRVAYTPEVVLGHRESASRGDLHPPADEALLIARWDLFGEYVDPSMPASVRYVAGAVELTSRAA